jgi:hypothetical protein
MLPVSLFLTPALCVCCVLFLTFTLTINSKGRAFGRQPPTAEARVQPQASPCRIFIGQSGTWTRFCFQILRIFPVSITPPLFHPHSFVYHRRCIILATDSVVK